MPLGAQLDDLVIEMNADFPAHGDDHGLAGLCRIPRFEVRHQIGCHPGNTRFGTYDALQCRPFALQPGLLAFLFILGQFIDLGVDMGQLVGLEGQLGQA